MALDSDLKNKLTYNSYLKIPELISLQEEKSEEKHHDEMLFIIIHQAYELWFKQILHEMDAIVKHMQSDHLFFVLKSLNRIQRILDVLIQQVDILETMTPTEFAGFRSHLNPASGFQSHQFRLFEYRLGLKNDAYLKFHEHTPEIEELLRQALYEKSIYDHVLNFLKRKSFDIPQELLDRDLSKQHQANASILELVKEVYTDIEANSDLYYLFENLLEVDEKVQLWRNRHVKMVQRMIGNKMGTGGSAGAKYLQSTVSKSFFPELWDVRDLLGKY